MMLRHFHRIFLLIFVSFLLFAGCLLFAWIQFLRTPIVLKDEGVRYEVRADQSLHAVIHDLYLLDVIKHQYFFDLLTWLRGDQRDLKAGEYLFPKGTTANSLLNQITSGSGVILHSFTIVAGWGFVHLRHALDSDPNLRHDSEKLSDAALMDRLGQPDLKPEGEFFPDTYYFVRGTSDLVILQRSFDLMQKKLADAWAHRELDLPYQSPMEALTVASLIEKETSIPHERQMISGVIVNRLRRNMLLQIDPTVIYAAGSHFHGIIHRSDLLRKSPYNTYVTKGLPPTPIGIPGETSIYAALHPQHNDYLYFVAKNYDMNGSHRFSVNWQEHSQAVKRAKHNTSRLDYFNNALIQHYFWRTILPGIYR